MTANKKQQIIMQLNKTFPDAKGKILNFLKVANTLQEALLAYFIDANTETYKNYIHAVAAVDIEIDKCRIYDTKIIEATKVCILEKLDREVK